MPARRVSPLLPAILLLLTLASARNAQGQALIGLRPSESGIRTSQAREPVPAPIGGRMFVSTASVHLLPLVVVEFQRGIQAEVAPARRAGLRLVFPASDWLQWGAGVGRSPSGVAGTLRASLVFF